MSHVCDSCEQEGCRTCSPDILQNMTLTSDTELTNRIRHMVYDEHFELKSP